MAERKNSGRKSGKPKNSRALPAAVLFWLVFFIAVTGVFLVNRETIARNFDFITQRLNLSPETASEDEAVEPEASPEGEAVATRPAGTPVESPAAPLPVPEPSVKEPVAGKTDAQPSPVEPPEKQTPAPQAAPAARPSSTPQTVPRPVETQERNLYFTQVGADGAIIRSRVSRKIALSDSPMLDSLQVLLAGPIADEKRRGMVSLIPPNTRILSAAVRGSTAYISFSEDFQYNTYGVEGYAAQLNQIVWTVTEFPNVKDVQILIEGRRVDYLGEGIWIGSPINRESP
ncbi:MAG: GerMN domain-containing protein [Treponema sp.]|nr:GerMN domain-containing protein [Treponema sp.]